MLFTPLTLRDVTLRNRIVVSPMCEYSSPNGFATDWHMVHLGSRAVGGAGLVLTEATAVTADGRISSADLGIYLDEHVDPLARIFRFIEDQGAVPGMQLAHAGRKASTAEPWKGGGPVRVADGGWAPIWAPSAIAFRDGWQTPRAMSLDDISQVRAAFADGRAPAARGRRKGRRDPRRARLSAPRIPVAAQQPARRSSTVARSTTARASSARSWTRVRAVWPERLPLFVRISATDWTDGGWTIEDSVALAAQLKDRGVDLIDCSSGGNVAQGGDSGRTWLPGAVCRADPARDRDDDRRGRIDHRAGSGRSDPGAGPGGRDRHGAAAVARSGTGRCTRRRRWASRSTRRCNINALSEICYSGSHGSRGAAVPGDPARRPRREASEVERASKREQNEASLSEAPEGTAAERRRRAPSMTRLIESSSAQLRLEAARAFVETHARDGDVWLVGASRGSVDDLARTIAVTHRRDDRAAPLQPDATRRAARGADPRRRRDSRPSTYLGSEAVVGAGDLRRRP